ncbi:MAG: type VI secretion system Vgr family protein [Phycisphaerae bacterium]
MSDAPRNPANAADFRLRIDDHAAAEIRVTDFEGVEGLSSLFRFRIGLTSENSSLTARGILGKPATLEIDGQRGTRVINGIIRRFERIGQGNNLTHYLAHLVPLQWLLTRNIQSRVFNKTRLATNDLAGIVAKVFADAALPAKILHNATVPTHDYREFTVQYRESDWAFISRLLEDEGIYYYFEHTADLCRVVLVDSKDAHSPFSVDGFVVPFREAANLLADQEFVFAARRSGQVKIGAVSLDDFDFKNPGRELQLDKSAEQFTGLLRSDYPGGYTETKRGRRVVQTRLEEEQHDAATFKFSSTVRDFWPGGRFKLTDHPDEQLNIEYLITRVTHRATQSGSADADAAGGAGSRYESIVRAIPADVQFRPPRVTPVPAVLGSQTAIVVGPPGEEIYTDEYGRVEVRFHWDQEAQHDAGASCWIRVSHGMAGGQYGMLFLPRVGQEVIVDFLEGNPDQPIITGRVYNKDHMPAYKLPDHRTVSSIRTCSSPGAKGGNEIRFEDKKGGEQLLLFAQNSLHMRSRGSRYESVCGNAHQTVAGDAFEKVSKSKYQSVGLDLIEEVLGSKVELLSNDAWTMTGGNSYQYTLGECVSHSIEKLTLTAGVAITLECSGNFIKLDENGITIVGKAVNINSGGAANGSMVPEIPENLSFKTPHHASTTEFGHNVRYSKSVVHADASEAVEIKEATSWIDIELVDEAGRPVPNEVYAIILPDGKKIGGTLDKFGRAHVAVVDPGLCQVTFPRLDAAAWEAIA